MNILLLMQPNISLALSKATTTDCCSETDQPGDYIHVSLAYPSLQVLQLKFCMQVRFVLYMPYAGPNFRSS